MKICKDILEYRPDKQETHEEVMDYWSYFDELWMDIAEKYEKGDESQVIWSRVIKRNHSRPCEIMDDFYNKKINTCNKKRTKFYKALYRICKVRKKYRKNEDWCITEVKNMLKRCGRNNLLESQVLWDFNNKYLNLIYKNYKSSSFSWIN